MPALGRLKSNEARSGRTLSAFKPSFLELMSGVSSNYLSDDTPERLVFTPDSALLLLAVDQASYPEHW